MGDGPDRGMFVVQVFDQSRASLVTNRLSSKCYTLAEQTHARYRKRVLNWGGARFDDVSRAFVHRRAKQRLKETAGG